MAAKSEARRTAPDHNRPQAGGRKATARQRFAILAARWREETADLSRLELKVSDPNYLGIVAIGERAVPFILADLRDNGGYWFPALEAITGEAPETEDERSTRQGLRTAWLRWGSERGLIAG
jgi:hypothetical protein